MRRDRGVSTRSTTEVGHTAIENEVRRRLADALAAAGVAQGRVSLEVLYMLPPEFVRVYTRLFDQALREDLATGTGDGKERPRDENIKRAIKGQARLKPGSRNKIFPNGARAGGKRFKLHWIIRDEHAFKVKGSIDRKLQRLAKEIERELSARPTDSTPAPTPSQPQVRTP